VERQRAEAEGPLDDLLVSEDLSVRHLEVDEIERPEDADVVEDLAADRRLELLSVADPSLDRTPHALHALVRSEEQVVGLGALLLEDEDLDPVEQLDHLAGVGWERPRGSRSRIGHRTACASIFFLS
jgi:hypothetical protein